MEKEEKFYKYIKALLNKTDDYRLIGRLAGKFMKELEEEQEM